MSAGPGSLTLVATPIGNLGDVSPRAVEALAAADVIACEDTRRTRKLLTHAGVSRPRLVAVHDRNEAARVPELVKAMESGQNVVLVSDAGMPGIADPGERLVAAAAGAGLPVSVVPGPSAAVAALVVSGLPTARWCFEGFLPRKGSLRTRRLAALSDEPRTVVLYEAPHRLARTISDLASACGPTRRVVIVRELTKRFEQVWRGTLAEALTHVDQDEPRGEFVIVLDGAPPAEPATETEVEAAVRARLAAGEDRRTVVAAVAAELGVPKRQVYEIATARH